MRVSELKGKLLDARGAARLSELTYEQFSYRVRRKNGPPCLRIGEAHGTVIYTRDEVLAWKKAQGDKRRAKP